ncbi:endoglycosylceramidase [Lentzea sp. NBRC 105346]|uniref:cellulase family glycosylhydrolase n=1 Tax=Lentzea sp. NBRC 105346 TaxID=3032205 RepID=UPI00249FD09E|nr:cellulase family glycosylhydrolase [Lentzea sp. NBRC 105346]GLZ33761.1 endoglycosylceramidase [Lentzea sp. NBRC 105346]
MRVIDGILRDSSGREVVLRGFNVSGTAKLAEYGGLPFASPADAAVSARAMVSLTGANAVRFLLTWAWVEPTPGVISESYLDGVAAQLSAFTDLGVMAYLDFHQDLYSRHLFGPGSRYTGDGAPAWAARGYPPARCRFCFHWGQNMKNNPAVTSATRDFWHNRSGIRAAFVDAAGAALAGLRSRLSPEAFALVIGVDPLNEPYAGRYAPGETSLSWERDRLWPFYQEFRAAMDAAGWSDKIAFVEPLVYWNLNVGFFAEPGGFPSLPPLGPRFVFNSHFYDARAQSVIFKPRNARDGEYAADFARIRSRAAELGTAAIVSEFGHPITSARRTSILKAMYQALDSGVPGASWWSSAASSGPVLSASQWHWDINYGRHHELQNDNPDRVCVDGDAMNAEHFSAVRLVDGEPVLTVDRRLLDRVYPRAVAGTTIAFTYEDRAGDLVWNRIPASLPGVRELVGAGRFAVLVWRGSGVTELRLPGTFATPTVVTDAGYEIDGGLRLSTQDTGVHFALVTDRPGGDPDRARSELASWVAQLGETR